VTTSASELHGGLRVTVNVFPGGFNWGLYVGRDKRFFAAHGIAVEILSTPDSVTQMTELAHGKFDIAMTAVDNIVAYVEGQGQAPIGSQAEFFAFMGSDSGFLSLVTALTITRIGDLKGKTVSVDAMTTGYAFVLYEVLRRNGLDKDRDNTLVSQGGMIQRWTALRKGRSDGTLLSAPYNLVARNASFTEPVKAIDVIGPYQGNVAAARRSWARDNAEKVVAYIRGYRAAIDWLYQPQNRAEAIAILRRNLPQLPTEVAEASYAELLDPVRGFSRSGAIDSAALQCVIDLRSRHAAPAKTLSEPEKYCDLRYLQLARGG